MRLGPLLAIVLVTGALSACDDGSAASSPVEKPSSFVTRHRDYISNQSSARKLRKELAGMHGVTKVSFEYEAGYRGYGDGYAGFGITLATQASDQDFQAVYRAAFRGMKADLPGDSANTGIVRGVDQASLHLDDSRAQHQDADAVLRFALDARRPHEVLDLYVSSSDQDDPRIIESQVTFKLPSGSDRDDVLPRLDGFDPEDVPEHADVQVLAADLSSLTGFDGFPTDEDRRIWSELNSGPYAESYTVDFGPLNIADGSSRNAMVKLDLKREAKPAQIRREHRAEFITAHVRILNASVPKYRFYINRGSGGILQLDVSVCGDESPFSGWRREVALIYSEHVCKD